MIRAADYQADSSTRAKNARAGKNGCFLCGRPLAKSGVRAIHLTTNDMIERSNVEVEPHDDQGWFEIGPECAKKLPPGYVEQT